MLENLLIYFRYSVIYKPHLFVNRIILRFYPLHHNSSTSSNNSNENSNVLRVLPEPPTTCCMSGCANCVWIDYATKLTLYFKDTGETAQQKILENVTDANMRAFLLMELRIIKFKWKTPV